MLQTNEVRIETSTLCNHKCLFCPHPTTFSRKQEIMSLDLFKLLLGKTHSEAPYITDCTVSGFGEIFTDPGIIDKIEYAHKKGYVIHVLTNGSLVTNAAIKSLVNMKVSDIRFSLHAVYAKTYARITGAGDFSSTIDILDYALANRDATKIIITMDVIDENRHEVNAMIAEYKDRADLIEIWKPHNWVNEMKYRAGDRVKQTCGRPFNGPLQVQVDGTVNMCCFDSNGVTTIGDLKTQTLDEIFSTEAYLNIRKHHEAGSIGASDLICKHCDQLYDSEGVVIYNSKYPKEPDRLMRTSTNYRKVFT